MSVSKDVIKLCLISKQREVDEAMLQLKSVDANSLGLIDIEK